MARLTLLQDAALARALRAFRADEGKGAEKSDAAFARNARLAALIVRLRLALARDDKAGEAAAEDGEAEVAIYRIPDNGRDNK